MATEPVVRTLEEITHARRRAEELVHARYPTREEVRHECDLVMKGGITSGVVYPLAVCELARSYRYCSIGGSSAGAIAAAMTAAAEYGRDDGGFTRLAALPSSIGSTLPALFKPGPHTQTAHAAVMAAIDPTASKRMKSTRIVRTLIRSQRRRFGQTTGIGFFVGFVITVLTVGVPSSAIDIAQFAGLALLFTLLAVVLGAAWALLDEARATWSGLSTQGFGICVGSVGAAGTSAADSAGADDPGFLSDWLTTRIDEIAGVEGPLTFGDLHARGINLQVMTTNLTHGRPMSFPFTGRVFLFDPEELGRYFPPRVIKRLIDGQEPATEQGTLLVGPSGNNLYRFPDAAGIPVVLAARFSLSFPGLISAVPLYAIDFSRARLEDRKPVRCWFSDGGITSNFPIHFFDALWPRRPTFGLDLRGYDLDRPESDVYYPGVTPRQPRVKSITDPRGFLAAILDTMQYWADDAQSVLPGYRDRVVEVHLHGDEGGMNLRMPADVIAMVAEKGRQAAEELANGFDIGRHRWTRFLTSMSQLQEVTAPMSDLFAGSLPGGEDGYEALLGRSSELGAYKRSGVWAAKATVRTRDLIRFGASREPDFTEDAPSPDPVLRITPRF